MNERRTAHLHIRCYPSDKQAYIQAAKATVKGGELSEYFRKLHREDVARRHQKLKNIRGE
jgi:hypothetical protein